MSTVAYTCPCCGAPLAYDAANNNLKCASCGNSYELEAMEAMNPMESSGGVQFELPQESFDASEVAHGVVGVDGDELHVGVLALLGEKESLIKECAKELKTPDVHAIAKKATSLQADIKELRRQLGAEDVPIIVGGLGDFLVQSPDPIRREKFRDYYKVNEMLEHVASTEKFNMCFFHKQSKHCVPNLTILRPLVVWLYYAIIQPPCQFGHFVLY